MLNRTRRLVQAASTAAATTLLLAAGIAAPAAAHVNEPEVLFMNGSGAGITQEAALRGALRDATSMAAGEGFFDCVPWGDPIFRFEQNPGWTVPLWTAGQDIRCVR
jgi:hypothetical protein